MSRCVSPSGEDVPCSFVLVVEYRRHGTRPPGCSLPRSNPQSAAAISGRLLLFQIFAQTCKIHFRQYFSWKKKDASICRRWHSNMIITGHLNTDLTGHDTNPHRLLKEKICSGWDEKLVSMAKTIKDAHELHREFVQKFFARTNSGSGGRWGGQRSWADVITHTAKSSETTLEPVYGGKDNCSQLAALLDIPADSMQTTQNLTLTHIVMIKLHTLEWTLVETSPK